MCPNIYSPKNIHTQKNISVLVAQLDRVSASEAEGRGFDSRQAHHFIKTLDNASVFCVNVINVIIDLAIIINLNNFNPISIWIFDEGDVFHRTLFRTLFKFYAICIKPSNRFF